jgi:AI-2 transport protein TqsA
MTPGAAADKRLRGPTRAEEGGGQRGREARRIFDTAGGLRQDGDMTRPTQTGESATSRVALVTLAVLAVLAVGYLMRPVVLPVALAVFFAVLGLPLQRRLQPWVGGPVALVLTVVGIGASLIALPLIFASNLQVVIARLPDYAARLAGMTAGIEAQLEASGVRLPTLDLASGSAVDALLSITTNAVTGLLDFLGTSVLVIFLLFFILAEANVIGAKLESALSPTNHAAVSASIVRIQQRIAQYVTTKTLFAGLNAGACALITLSLGIDFPALWSLLTFTLYFIPNLGIIIATFPPVLIALLQFEGPGPAILALVLLTVAFNLIGNVLEPRYLGKTLALSPFVVFVSLMVWGWYLGLLGVVLAIPLTVVMRIVCDHVEPLRPLGILMSDRAPPRRAKAEGGEARDEAPTRG